MKTIAELKQELGQLYDEARAIVEKADTEKRATTDEENDQYNALVARMDALRADIERREKLEGFVGVSKPQSDRGSQYHSSRKVNDTPEGAFCVYLRTGDQGAMNELRAYNNTDMNVTTAADGEVIVPVGMVQDIMARRDEMALFPKLNVTRVPGKGTTVNYPIDNEADVLFLTEAESADIDQDAPALTEKAFTLAKYAKYITLTWELLRDEDANLMAFLNNWVARGWAATHNSALVTEVLASGTSGLSWDAATAIAAAEIPELVGKVLPEYQEGAQWLMHPTTKAYIEGLKGDNFHFAPTPNGTTSSLWGYPNNATSYMTALGAGVKSAVFGNFNFLGMREGTGLTTLRDPYSVATKGQVRIHYWFDLVYGVLQAEAIQYATHPTA